MKRLNNLVRGGLFTCSVFLSIGLGAEIVRADSSQPSDNWLKICVERLSPAECGIEETFTPEATIAPDTTVIEVDMQAPVVVEPEAPAPVETVVPEVIAVEPVLMTDSVVDEPPVVEPLSAPVVSEAPLAPVATVEDTDPSDSNTSLDSSIVSYDTPPVVVEPKAPASVDPVSETEIAQVVEEVPDTTEPSASDVYNRVAADIQPIPQDDFRITVQTEFETQGDMNRFEVESQQQLGSLEFTESYQTLSDGDESGGVYSEERVNIRATYDVLDAGSINPDGSGSETDLDIGIDYYSTSGGYTTADGETFDTSASGLGPVVELQHTWWGSDHTQNNGQVSASGGFHFGESSGPWVEVSVSSQNILMYCDRAEVFGMANNAYQEISGSYTLPLVCSENFALRGGGYARLTSTTGEEAGIELRTDFRIGSDGSLWARYRQPLLGENSDRNIAGGLQITF